MPERAFSAGARDARGAELLNAPTPLAALAAVAARCPTAARAPLRRIRTLGVQLISRPLGRCPIPP
jgi:hypothetical protein